MLVILVDGLHGVVPQGTGIVDLVVDLEQAGLQVVRVVGVMQLPHQLLLVASVVRELSMAQVAAADRQVQVMEIKWLDLTVEDAIPSVLELGMVIEMVKQIDLALKLRLPIPLGLLEPIREIVIQMKLLCMWTQTIQGRLLGLVRHALLPIWEVVNPLHAVPDSLVQVLVMV